MCCFRASHDDVLLEANRYAGVNLQSRSALRLNTPDPTEVRLRNYGLHLEKCMLVYINIYVADKDSE